MRDEALEQSLNGWRRAISSKRAKRGQDNSYLSAGGCVFGVFADIKREVCVPNGLSLRGEGAGRWSRQNIERKPCSQKESGDYPAPGVLRSHVRAVCVPPIRFWPARNTRSNCFSACMIQSRRELSVCLLIGGSDVFVCRLLLLGLKGFIFFPRKLHVCMTHARSTQQPFEHAQSKQKKPKRSHQSAVE
jgi:hypothetical protein